MNDKVTDPVGNVVGVDAPTDERERGIGHLVESATGARLVHRPALTFKVRRRSLSPARQAQFDEWIQRWSIPLEGDVLDRAAVFDQSPGAARPLVLDIGFGHGESTIRMAHAQPEFDVIGVEVHDPGVMTVLDAIENDPLPNVRVVHGDLLRFLPRLGPASIAIVRIFFPDPWKKKRQHHRRLVRSDVVTALVDRLEVGGELQLATDIVDYAESMQAVCEAEPRVVGGVVARPDARPLTRFERRGLDEGRTIVDLRYTRIEPDQEAIHPTTVGRRRSPDTAD